MVMMKKSIPAMAKVITITKEKKIKIPQKIILKQKITNRTIATILKITKTIQTMEINSKILKTPDQALQHSIKQILMLIMTKKIQIKVHQMI